MSQEQIVDPDVAQLAGLSASLEVNYVNAETDPWLLSPFGWIHSRSSRQIGAIGEKLVSSWAEANGFKVERSGDSDSDRIINGHRIEIKYSNLWATNGIYKFQQIRNQNYDYCFCLGISPFDAHAWFIPKAELMQDRPPSLVPQHGGASGRDTRWLSFPAGNPPSWLSKFGGSLNQVRLLMAEAGTGKHSGR